MAKILIIDDDKLASDAIKRALESTGEHEVLYAPDGEAGLVSARQELPDVILLDILMPKMDGYEVLKELKAEENTLNIPVIMITAVSNEQSIKEAVYEYDALYMTKPIDPQALIKTVNHALSTSGE